MPRPLNELDNALHRFTVEIILVSTYCCKKVYCSPESRSCLLFQAILSVPRRESRLSSNGWLLNGSKRLAHLSSNNKWSRLLNIVRKTRRSLEWVMDAIPCKRNLPARLGSIAITVVLFALRAIAGESPVRPEDRGDVDGVMTASRLSPFDWGRRNFYI